MLLDLSECTEWYLDLGIGDLPLTIGTMVCLLISAASFLFSKPIRWCSLHRGHEI